MAVFANLPKSPGCLLKLQLSYLSKVFLREIRLSIKVPKAVTFSKSDCEVKFQILLLEWFHVIFFFYFLGGGGGGEGALVGFDR